MTRAFTIRDGWGNQHSAIVRYDDGTELELPETQYRYSGYESPFDDLPWKVAKELISGFGRRPLCFDVGFLTEVSRLHH